MSMLHIYDHERPPADYAEHCRADALRLRDKLRRPSKPMVEPRGQLLRATVPADASQPVPDPVAVAAVSPAPLKGRTIYKGWIGPFLPLRADVGQRDLNAPVYDEDEVSVQDCIRAVLTASVARMLDIVSARRTAEVVAPRQVAMWLARRFTTKSLPEIGRRFGDRDHTTILHAYRKIECRIEGAGLALADSASFDECLAAAFTAMGIQRRETPP